MHSPNTDCRPLSSPDLCVHASPIDPRQAQPPGPAGDADVVAAIASYVPTCLPPARWARCADVARAAVAATNPRTAKVARALLAHLCQFLSTPCGWAGDGPPDLAALLTQSTIAAYTYTAGGVANRASGVIRRTSLRRIARAAGSVAPAPLPYAKTTTTALRPELLAAARQPLPLAGIAQAWEHRHDRALPQDAFRPVVAALQAGGESTAAWPDAGTLTLPASLRVLAEATDQPVKEVAASMNKPSPAGAPRAAKKLSRRAVLRYARANLAAGEAHRAGPTLADAPAPGTLSEEVAAAIAAYQPEKKNRGSWAEVKELTRRLTLGYALQAVAAQIIQAYEVEDDDHVTFAGEVDWVCERAPVDEADEVIRRYLAGPCVRASSGVRPATTLGSQVERRQLQTEPQQPGLLGGDGCRVGSGQVT